MASIRDKILKDGPVRYRETTMIGLQKWRSRYLVFKVTHAGRLQLILHKEHPPTAANELKEIAIDEFGGLEHNLKIDNERYVCAVITTHATECFSTETPQELTEWKQLLQEYLGKELVINISVPQKQHLLKAGKAFLRIRNTGFTITTNDNPPRCQGTWQIIHVRKYGGSGLFRFETGSKCPTGEYRYAIETKENAAIKKLFNDLSNHKPIFADDRLGRRMTLERSLTRNTHRGSLSPSKTVNNRGSDPHLYENREQFQSFQGQQYLPDLSLPDDGARRASFDNGIVNSGRMDSLSDEREERKISASEDENRLYQNVSQGRNPYQEAASPTKKSHFSPVSVPVPEGYYNLTPPTLVKHRNSSNGSPSSSPDETTVHESMTFWGAQNSSNPEIAPYDQYSRETSAAVVGDSPMGNRTSHDQRIMVSSASEIGSVYQNVEFMRGSSSSDRSSRRSIPEPLTIDEHNSSIPSTISEEAWSPHNYTNVTLAHAGVQGRSNSRTKIIRSRNSRMSYSPLHTTQKTVERKVSVPIKSKSSQPPVPLQSLLISSSSDDLLSPSPAPITSTPVLRNSLSNFELNTSGNKENRSLDYYNYCAPNLPAHSNSQGAGFSLRNKLTLSSARRNNIQSESAFSDRDSMELLSPTTPGEVGYSRIHGQLKRIDNSKIYSSDYSEIEDFKSNLEPQTEKLKCRSCDCLDSRGPASNNPVLLVDDRPESQSAMYDTLAPRSTIGTSSQDGLYDSLEPYREELKSGSSSPDPYISLPSDIIGKNIKLRREHNYEEIDAESEEKESGKSGSTSPVEYPSIWTTSLPAKFTYRNSTGRKSPHPKHLKETKTLSRRKNLPLQEPDDQSCSETEQNAFPSEYTAIKKVRPPKLSRETVDFPKKPASSHSDRSRVESQQQSSFESNELVSSTDSVSGMTKELLFSNGSTSSGELDIKPNDRTKPVRSHSPGQRVTHENVAIKTTPSHNVGGNNENDAAISIEPPPIPQRMPMEGKSLQEATSANNTPPLPPKFESRVTIPLPVKQYTFKPPPPPKPRVLCPPPETTYAAVTFANGEDSVPLNSSPVIKGQRPSMRIAETSDNVPYVSVDFEMTAGLQRTSEEVADHQREFLQKQQY